MADHHHGPWHLELLIPPRLRILFTESTGRMSGAPVQIGRTKLEFEPNRAGTKRGLRRVTLPFAAHDLATARIIAAAPEMLQQLKDCENYLEGILAPCDPDCTCILHGLQALLTKIATGQAPK